jgi:hypothetical protein
VPCPMRFRVGEPTAPLVQEFLARCTEAQARASQHNLHPIFGVLSSAGLACSAGERPAARRRARAAAERHAARGHHPRGLQARRQLRRAHGAGCAPSTPSVVAVGVRAPPRRRSRGRAVSAAAGRTVSVVVPEELQPGQVLAVRPRRVPAALPHAPRAPHAAPPSLAPAGDGAAQAQGEAERPRPEAAEGAAARGREPQRRAEPGMGGRGGAPRTQPARAAIATTVTPDARARVRLSPASIRCGGSDLRSGGFVVAGKCKAVLQ